MRRLMPSSLQRLVDTISLLSLLSLARTTSVLPVVAAQLWRQRVRLLRLVLLLMVQKSRLRTSPSTGTHTRLWQSWIWLTVRVLMRPSSHSLTTQLTSASGILLTVLSSTSTTQRTLMFGQQLVGRNLQIPSASSSATATSSVKLRQSMFR